MHSAQCTVVESASQTIEFAKYCSRFFEIATGGVAAFAMTGETDCHDQFANWSRNDKFR